MILGIESTAHSFGVGIFGDKVLANVVDMYRPKKGGFVPRQAADHHVAICKKVLDEALAKAKVTMEQVDGIAFSAGPGMPPCLRIGAVLARSLALKYDKSIIPVNHCVAHIEIGKFATRLHDPVVLYVSGGNTQVLAFTEGRYRTFGEAIDVPLGNAFDQLARELGVPHPGGLEIEKLAKKGKWIELPYSVKGMDVSFSGILTAAINRLKTEKKEDVCFSFQETCFAMLTEVAERAMAHTGKKELLLTGGVAANSRLQEMLGTMTSERSAKFAVVPKEFSGDNGAMIAYCGSLIGKKFSLEDTKINRYWRSDETVVDWVK
jgi:universal protein Kae1